MHLKGGNVIWDHVLQDGHLAVWVVSDSMHHLQGKPFIPASILVAKTYISDVDLSGICICVCPHEAAPG